MHNSEAGPSTWATEGYDVFLNHRGPDVKDTFVADLEVALRSEKFRPFLDRLSLMKGNPAHEFIYQALDMARVHVAVVSKGYAQSKYCLDELVAMMRSRKPVIPVFYDVEPMDLRRVESGPFKEAFEKHKSRESQEKLKEWTDALRWLANITGFCLAHYKSDEAKLKDEVVNEVKRCSGAGAVDEDRRFGLEKSRNEVVRKLRSGRDGVVGLYGVGGIGKTTLATAVYDYFALDFQHRSFLSDVRSSNALDLQNKILHDLTGLKKGVSSPEDYQIQFHQFKDLKALIVVDNIDNESQFRDIIPDLGKISKDSRIVVTSRDQGLLSNVLISTPPPDKTEQDNPVAETEKSVLHEVEGLNSDESQQLFNFKALITDSTHSVFKHLAVKVADGCRGHPLALEIAGGFLRNRKNLEKDRVYWEEIASTATRNDTLQNILQISYEKGLFYCQKTMFLDIACLLVGELSEVALEIWASCESCGCGIRPGVHSSLGDLMDKCLVKLDNHGRLRMHDVNRDMGRKIVEDSVFIGGFKKWERTHFWDPVVADKFLEAEEGSVDQVRSFSRARQDRVGDTSIPTYNAEAFSKMSQLHFLVLDGCLVSGDFSKWSRELRLLQWKFSALSELPLELNLGETAVVDLSGSNKLARLWNDETPLRKSINLRRLILNNCISLTTLPRDIGTRLSKLTVLELGNCVMLETLPDSIGEMKDLEHMILRGCHKLRSIPRTVGRLKKLKHLDLTGCSSLEILPDAIVNLTQLEKLIVVGCDKLQELPMDFRKLANLKVLQLHSDKEVRMALYIGGLKMVQMLHLSLAKLKTLPDDLGQLTGLTDMSLGGCTELTSIPDVGTLRLLKTLSLSSCHGLGSLPESLGSLTALTTLVLQCNNSITELPESLSGLVSLDRLQMDRCPKLRTVKALPHSLRHLDLANCPKLEHLPSFEGLRPLATLILCNCARLEEIQGLDGLTALEEVNLAGCTSLPPGTVQLQPNRAMRSCCLSGSNVAVKYDSDWSESEPEQQLISYYDDAFRFIADGLVQRVYAVEHCHKVCMEATVVGENECVAIVICCVAHDQGWSDFVWDHGHYRSECFLDAWIVRNGQEILRSPNLITLKHADCRDQVYLCTLRRTHPLVKGLRHGDMIRVAARSDHPKCAIFVESGAICVVHGDGEDQVISVNSRLLDVQLSREKRAELAGLVLADNPECPEGIFVSRSEPSIPDLEPGSFYVVPRFFAHTFNPFWMFRRLGQGVVSFVAHSIDDVEVNNLSVCISPQRGQAVPRYEICIGSGLSWIRRHLLPGDSDSNQYGVVRFFGLDNPLGRNPLWVSIDKENGELRVGRGEAHEDVFLEYQDHDFFSDVQYISFSTYGSPIVFSDVTVME